MNKSPWLDERLCARAIELWSAREYSALGICTALNREFGLNLTRNAVLGWAHRNHLAGRPREKVVLSVADIAQRRVERREREREARVGRAVARASVIEKRAPVVQAPFRIRDAKGSSRMVLDGLPVNATVPKRRYLPVNGAQPKALLELLSHECRWPLGYQDDRAELFCSEPVRKGFAYCAVHTRLAYPKSVRDPAIKPVSYRLSLSSTWR